MDAEMVSLYHSMGCIVIEEKEDAKKAFLDAREEKFKALEHKDQVERRLRAAIIKRAGGWKGLGSNDTARKEELDRCLAMSKVFKGAVDAYHATAAAEAQVEAVLETLDDYRKMHQAALYALGGIGEK